MIPTAGEDIPGVTPEAVVARVRETFGLDATRAVRLPGERDHNFRIDDPRGPCAVFKVVHPEEPQAALDMQAALLRHVASVAPAIPLPRLIDARGDAHNALHGSHRVRLVSWMPGTPLADSGRDEATLTAVGRAVGRLRNALHGFGHPGAFRQIAWDIRRAPESRQRLEAMPHSQRAVVERAVARFEAVEQDIPKVPHAVLHGDLNDWNVLVGEGGVPEVTGIIDLGDAVFGPEVADLAIAATYAALGAASPLEALCAVVSGYRSERALSDSEADLLPGLILGRLATSLSIAAQRRAALPTADEYLFVSEAPAWALLEFLDQAPEPLVHAALRRAGGVPASRRTRAFGRWLQGVHGALKPILGAPLERQSLRRLSWQSPQDPMVRATVAGDRDVADACYRRVRDEQQFDVGVGAWGERRAVYAAPAFESRLIPGRRRDVHLGLDLFADAGTPVASPVDARVVAVADCNRPQDYGGVVLLEHAPEPGCTFRTLWGHLDPASIGGLRAGDHVAAGVAFAVLGDSHVNGGWVPHLHLQVSLTDEGDPEGIVGVGEESLMELWAELYPDPTHLAGVPPEVLTWRPEQTDAVARARESHFGTNLKLSYRRPLHIVRGRDVWLHDASGRAYLDCYNNVAHVGHCHPRVVDAMCRQAGRLNTNTRYLHQLIGEYAERLTATFPPGFDTCFFTNSGSEANELALRMARTITGRRDIVVLDWAYHGNTQAVIDASPYKYKRAGGQGRPATTWELPVPDPYRAPADWAPESVGLRYAESMEALLHSGVTPAAFIAETIPSCAGQVVVPQGFFTTCFQSIRESGGLCIMDEVQVGFGRVGTGMWAFEEHGVVPDIVTLGKPMGNGHPLGAVVTTRAIATAFANGMEYFNTFGGNPVSCAAGLAVLDVLRDQQLLTNARRQGDRILGHLRALAESDLGIGDVRGRGLFLGAEIVTDPETREPDTSRARRMVEFAREHGVLMGTDGPHDNVLKLRPPMTVSDEAVELLLAVLESASRTTK